jgi:hypothetical protein
MNTLENDINKLIGEIEKKLLNGHITSNTPELALNYNTKLGGYLSTCYGLIERLDIKESEYFVNNKTDLITNLAVSKNWKVTNEGIRQKFWENRITRLKVLIDTVLPLYYAGRREKEIKELK